PIADAEVVGEQLASPEKAEIDSVMKSWGTLTVPSSILAVIDASGSMDFPAGDTTRMALAVNAARTALVAFPSHARIGLWAFSINQGGPGQDWRELAPLRRLDAPTEGGRTQVELLDDQAGVLAGLTQGGTGLYDTVLDAYRTATREYNPSYYNTVAVLSDGANDDPGSIGLRALLKELRQLHDPDRPVRIIPVGISTDADMAALRRIAAATESRAYEAANPQDILTVLAQGLLTR
ncbi:VWA domain-containing protein, partial [Nocardioides sp.]|uniref:VWA domain-containing protein n=1 Tax=Nocardioides sp. TaxID=35761 RepID=UPI00286E8CCC